MRCATRWTRKYERVNSHRWGTDAHRSEIELLYLCSSVPHLWLINNGKTAPRNSEPERRLRDFARRRAARARRVDQHLPRADRGRRGRVGLRQKRHRAVRAAADSVAARKSA